MRYDAEDRNIQMLLTGDSMISRPMSVFREPHFLELVEMIREADVALTNTEILFHDYESAPTAVPIGTYMRADPRMIEELQWMGFNLIATANNHQYDFGEIGLITHLGNLRKSGVTFAGIGETMALAREPHYLETNAGRVALISCTSTGPSGMYAGHQWREGRGRPGANMIRYTTRFTVDDPTFHALLKMRDELGLTRGTKDTRVHRFANQTWGMMDEPDSEESFYLGSLHGALQGVVPSGVRIARGERFATTLIPVQQDLEENLQRISDARRSADWVVVSFHNHENGDTADDPSNVATTFARAAIDAGADVFHGHGPHRDRGIEIYKGRPIFHSIGMFISQSETVARVPHENMLRQGVDAWQGVPADFFDSRSGVEAEGEFIGHSGHPADWRDIVAIVEFRGGALSGIRLQPIDMGYLRPRSQRGRPVIATGTEAQEVLQLFQRLSEPYGTHIEIDGDVGSVSIS